MTSSRRQLRRETGMDVEDLPYAMDTIDTIRMRSSLSGRAERVGLVDDGIVASLSSDIPEPLFNSVFALRFIGTATMAIWLANCALSAGAVIARPTHAPGR